MDLPSADQMGPAERPPRGAPWSPPIDPLMSKSNVVVRFRGAPEPSAFVTNKSGWSYDRSGVPLGAATNASNVPSGDGFTLPIAPLMLATFVISPPPAAGTENSSTLD